jgi:subtilisin family serine protease
VTAASGGARSLTGGISRIWLDGKREVTLDESVPRIGAPVAWAAGYYGSGVTVGVLDAGIDTSHPDLLGRIVAEANFTGAQSRRSWLGCSGPSSISTRRSSTSRSAAQTLPSLTRWKRR